MTSSPALISTDQIQVEVTIRLGSTRMSVAELGRLHADDILTLDQDISHGVEICVGDKVIAYGELAASESSEARLNVRITGAAPEA